MNIISQGDYYAPDTSTSVIDLLTDTEALAAFHNAAHLATARDLLERAVDADYASDHTRLRGLWHLAQDLLRDMGYLIKITASVAGPGGRPQYAIVETVNVDGGN